jgi:hypothetical protein
MEIVADRLAWTQFDEENWNRFLETETGKRVIPKLLESVPGLLGSGDTNAILIRSGEHRGLQLAVTQLLSMAHSTPDVKTETANEAYPLLTDDTAWNDGLKLTEAPSSPNPNIDIV